MKKAKVDISLTGIIEIEVPDDFEYPDEDDCNLLERVHDYIDWHDFVAVENDGVADVNVMYFGKSDFEPWQDCVSRRYYRVTP